MKNTVKQCNGAAKVLIIILVAILVLVVGGVAAFFIAKSMGAIDGVNLSPKAKLMNSFTGLGNKLEISNKDVNKVKIMNSLNEKPYEAEIKLSANINDVTIPGVSATEVASVKSMVNGADITLKTQADLKNDKQNSKLLLSGTELGSLIYTPDVLAVNVPEMDSKYMAIFKDSLAGTKYSSLTELFDMVNKFQFSDYDLSKYEFSDSEKEHFKKVYANIFSDNIKDDQLKTEQTEIEIDGKKISCDKVVLELTPAQCGELLEKYVSAYENDSEGRDIIANKIIAIFDSMPTMDAVLEEQGISKSEFNAQIKTALSQMSTSFKSVVDGLKNSTANIKMSINVYADVFKTYRTEFKIEGDGNSIVLSSDLKDDGAYSKMVFDVGSSKFEMNIDLLKNGFRLGFDYPEKSVKFNVSSINSDNKTDMELVLNMYNQEIASLKGTTTISSNSDNEFKSNTVLNVKVNYQNVNVDGNITMDSSIKIIDSVDIPAITSENSVDLVKTGALDSIMNSLDGLFGGKSPVITPSVPSVPSLDTSTTTDLFNTATTPSTTTDLFNTTTTDSSLLDF